MEGFTLPEHYEIYSKFMSEPYEVIEETNELIKILEAFPGKDWDWEELSGNPNITESYIKKNLDRPWDWEELAYNPNIHTRFIIEYGGKYRFNHAITANPNITLVDALKFPIKLVYWQHLLKNPNVPLDHIEQVLLEKNGDGSLIRPWWWRYATYHPKITLEFIRKHMDKQLDLKYLSGVFWNILPIVKEFSHKMWEWDVLSYNPFLTVEFIKEFPTKPWSFDSLSENELEKSKYVLKHNKRYVESQYRTILRTRIIEEELMEKTWDPNRSLNVPRIMNEIIN